MIEVLLFLITVSHVAMATVVVLRAGARDEFVRQAYALPEGPRDRPRYPVVFAPLACGIATSFAGLTGPCARRRNHGPRCMTDDEIEHVAEHGVTPTVVLQPPAEEWEATHA
jgi:hypothetical protein